MFKLLLNFIGTLIATALIQWLIKRMPQSLLENAVTGYLDSKIGYLLGLTEAQVDGFLLQWAVPILIGTLLVVIWHKVAIKVFYPSKVTGEEAPHSSRLLNMTIVEGDRSNRRPWQSSSGNTFGVKIENISSHKPISDCKVTVLKVEPDTGYRAPWVLKPRFSLAAGEHLFIPLATHHKTDTLVKLETTNERPVLGVDKEYIASIRATSPDSAFCDIDCKIWVKDGDLHVEKA